MDDVITSLNSSKFSGFKSTATNAFVGYSILHKYTFKSSDVNTNSSLLDAVNEFIW